jgi:hypothetical protein
MILSVTPMRQHGQARPNHDVQTAEPVKGNVIIAQAKSEAFGRYSNIAQFQMSGAADPQPIPPLHDAVMSWMGPLGFVLTGHRVD